MIGYPKVDLTELIGRLRSKETIVIGGLEVRFAHLSIAVDERVSPA